MRSSAIALVLVVSCFACSKSGDKADDNKGPAKAAVSVPANAVDMGSFNMRVPKTWKSEPPKSSMRKAQYMVPGKAGPTSLVIYYFGKGGAGGVQANLDRWIGQIKQPDGKSSKAAAKIVNKTIGGMAVTTVDVSGHYTAAMRPGGNTNHDKPNTRMLAAIVVASDGPYYFKMVGPAATVAAEKPGFDQLVASLRKGN